MNPSLMHVGEVMMYVTLGLGFLLSSLVGLWPRMFRLRPWLYPVIVLSIASFAMIIAGSKGLPTKAFVAGLCDFLFWVGLILFAFSGVGTLINQTYKRIFYYKFLFVLLIVGLALIVLEAILKMKAGLV